MVTIRLTREQARALLIAATNHNVIAATNYNVTPRNKTIMAAADGREVHADNRRTLATASRTIRNALDALDERMEKSQ